LHSQETATQRARAIARAANAGRVKRKHKKHVARTPVAVEKYKQLFLAQLEKGRSPGVAARNIKIARCTAYGWRKTDQEFDAAWRDAVETGLDKVESRCMMRAISEDSIADAHFLLKHRRYDKERIERPSQFDARRGPLTIVPHNGTGWEHQPVFLLEPS
jgi:hypothetical protein